MLCPVSSTGVSALASGSPMMNKGSDSSSTLVKYDNPRLVTTTNPDDDNNKGKRQGNSATRVTSSKAEDILNSILPPREFTTSEGQLWVQNVSSTPSTRQDVIALQKQLDSKLLNEKVRATGLCPVRAKLYAQVGKCSNRHLVVTAHALLRLTAAAPPPSAVL